LHDFLVNLAYPAAGLVTATIVLIMLSRSWRWSLAALALQYLGVFLLSALKWPLEMAAVKLVAGWMAGAILAIAGSEANLAGPKESGDPTWGWLSSRVFRFIVAGLGALVVLSIVPQAVLWIPGLSFAQAWGSLILIGVGLIYLGLTAQPFRVAIGLLTIFSGFEIIYAAVEASALVAGLLALVNLGLALASAYVLTAPLMEQDQ
jgi:hypothetical protein